MATHEYRVGDVVILPAGGNKGEDTEGKILKLDATQYPTIALVEWFDGFHPSHVRITSLRYPKEV